MALAPHVRKQIRDTFADLLQGIEPPVRVLVNQKEAVDQERLPAILVSTPSEEVTVETMGRQTRTFSRVLTLQLGLMVEATEEAGDQAEDRLDELAAKIEERLTSDDAAHSLKALSKDWFLTSVTPAFNAESKVMLGASVMTYRVVYCTIENAPREAA